MKNNIAIDFDLMSYADLVKFIQDRFCVMERILNRVIKGSVTSFIVSGEPGLGKSFLTEKALEAAHNAGTIRYVKVKGAMSAIGLYKKLYECRDSNTVLLLDDADGIFDNKDSLNLLKAALDSKAVRQINYNKISAALTKNGIPLTFDFGGRVIFITNENFEAQINAGGRLAPHLKALMSRSIYLNLGIHGMRAAFARIVQLACSTNVVTKYGCTEAQIVEILEWLKANLSNLHELSIRTVERLASSIVDNPTDWKMEAEITLLRSNNDY